MTESMIFEQNPMEIKRKSNDNCMECNAKYTMFSGQHICKRCYRSVCSDCHGSKTLIWSDNFKQQIHRLCKFCRQESDAIKTSIKAEKLVFAQDSDLAKKWKKSIPAVEESYRNAKKSIEFGQELLNELWNSLTYSMKDFVGSVLGDNPSSKLPTVQKHMKYVLNELNSRTEIRIQNAAYIALLVLCYASPNNAVVISQYLITQLRKCQTERQIINDTLKQLSCNSSQIKNMEDYIDQRMRKFVTVLGMNTLESSLVQNVLRDMFQTSQSIMLMYSSVLATEKKVVGEKGRSKQEIDIALLREGNVIEIKKNYNRIRNKTIKNKERKNSKKYNQDEPDLIPKTQQKVQKVIETRSEIKMAHSLSNVQVNEFRPQHKPIQTMKSQSFLQQIVPTKPTILNISEYQSIPDRTLSNPNGFAPRQFGDEWKIKQKRRRFQKTGSYMDLSMDFQVKLRQMKSLGMEHVVSSTQNRRVHRIKEKFELLDDEQEYNRAYSQLKDNESNLNNSNIESVYYMSEQGNNSRYKQQTFFRNNSAIQRTPIRTQNLSLTNQIQDNYSSKDSQLSKKQEKSIVSSVAKFNQKQSVNSSPKIIKNNQSNKFENIFTEQSDTLTKTQIQLKQSVDKQKQLQQQTVKLRQMIKYYEKVLPEKETVIKEYRSKEKQSGNIQVKEASEINKYKNQSKNLQQRVLKLEMENKRLEKEKNKLQSQTMLNRSSVPTNRDTSPEGELNVSVYSSSKTVGRDGKSTESVSELKKDLRLLEFTLKEKNEYIHTITLENKRLIKEFQDYKRNQNRRIELIKQEYQNQIADLQLQKTKSKYQNQRMMKKLQEMTLSILSLEAQLFQQNRKQFDYQ